MQICADLSDKCSQSAWEWKWPVTTVFRVGCCWCFWTEHADCLMWASVSCLQGLSEGEASICEVSHAAVSGVFLSSTLLSVVCFYPAHCCQWCVSIEHALSWWQLCLQNPAECPSRECCGLVGLCVLQQFQLETRLSVCGMFVFNFSLPVDLLVLGPAAFRCL